VGVMDVASGVVVIGGALTTAIALAAWLHRSMRKMVTLAEDLLGEQGRPGVAPRPGVMERLAGIEGRFGKVETRLSSIEAELHPNGGTTVRDALDRIEQHVMDGGSR
jgi:hypothetical protein